MSRLLCLVKWSPLGINGQVCSLKQRFSPNWLTSGRPQEVSSYKEDPASLAMRRQIYAPSIC